MLAWTWRTSPSLLRLQTASSSLQLPPVRTSKVSKQRKEVQRKKAPHLSSVRARIKTPSVLAQEYFDMHYAKEFGSRWHSIRLALLTAPQHSALVNNVAPVEETCESLKKLGCISLRDTWKAHVASIANHAAESQADLANVPSLPTERPIKPQENEESESENSKIPSMPADQNVLRDRFIKPSQDSFASGSEDGTSAATMFSFVASTDLKGMEDYIEEEDYFKSYTKVAGVPMPMVAERLPFAYPEHLNAFVFPSSCLSRFPEPRSTSMDGAYDYFCMDAASLLPVVALGLCKGEHVLDMCAGPGGKSLAIMQTLMPGRLVANDIKGERLKRVMNIMSQYLKQVGDLKDVIEYKRWDAAELPAIFPSAFDKVLCDVPCFTDRHVVKEDDNNLFGSHRNKERLTLPDLQTDLLVAALRCTRPGGSVVYSTCSLSPMQNDGVVHAAMKQIWEESSIEYLIKDLKKVFLPFKKIMRIARSEYGQLVVPNICQNYGPMYIAKITRTK